MNKVRIYAFVSAMLLCLVALQPVDAKNDKKKKKVKVEEKVEAVTPLVDRTQVTEECLINLSLFTENVKIKNYADALDPWTQVYENCPSASRNIFTLGEKIIYWEIEQATTPEEKAAKQQKLLTLYDEWMVWFNDEKTPAAQTLVKKAEAYTAMFPEDQNTPYQWLKNSIETMGNKSSAYSVHKFMVASYHLQQADSTLTDQFINDYTTSNNILEANIADQTYADTKQQMDVLFANSGAADCEKMNEIFLPAIEANKENADYLNSKIRLLRRMDCNEEESYFLAATYLNAISPSAESAAGLGSMNLKKGEYSEAIKYFEQAIGLTDNDEDKANYLLNIATTYYKMKNYAQARSYCKRSIDSYAQAQAYIMLGLVYASGPSVSDDPVLARGKYWAAVDQFIKARNLAGENKRLEKTASNYISSYSRQFPEKTDVFMHPDLNEGKSYTVGGWIGESTTVRCK